MDFASRAEQSPRSRREILFRARRSIGARSSRAYLGVAGFRGGGLVDVLQGRKFILDFFDLGTHGVSGALEQCGRSGPGGGKVFFGAKLRKNERRSFGEMPRAHERTDEVGTSRRLLSSRERSTLDARRSIACLPTRPVARPLPHARFTSSSPRAVPTSPPPRRAPHRSRRRAVRKSALASAAARRHRPAVPRRT